MTTEFINNLKEKTKATKEDLEIDLITEISRHDSDLMREMEKQPSEVLMLLMLYINYQQNMKLLRIN